jgi:hypothetical protein
MSSSTWVVSRLDARQLISGVRLLVLNLKTQPQTCRLLAARGFVLAQLNASL